MGKLETYRKIERVWSIDKLREFQNSSCEISAAAVPHVNIASLLCTSDIYLKLRFTMTQNDFQMFIVKTASRLPSEQI
jgi:hypothetical protein